MLTIVSLNKPIIAELLGSFDEFFDKNFGIFLILPEEDCEDRSVSPIEPELKSYQDEGLATLRLVDDNEEIQNLESPLFFCHRMLIDSVADILQEREILIVPDRSLNQVPFGAPSDENGECLCGRNLEEP